MSASWTSILIGLAVALVAFKVLKGIVKLVGLLIAIVIAVAFYYGLT